MIKDPIDMEIDFTNQLLSRFKTPSVTQAHHEQAVSVAADRAAQEQFEADVKAVCEYCRGTERIEQQPIHRAPFYTHTDPVSGSLLLCHASAIRLAFPARSERMNAARA